VNAIRYKKRILHPAEASVSYIPEEVITNKLVKFLGILLTILVGSATSGLCQATDLDGKGTYGWGYCYYALGYSKG